MSKKFSKFLLALVLIIMTVSSFSVCFATEAVATSEGEAVTTSESENTAQENAETTEEIHNGDLYLFDNEIVMDKLVDGNVFLFGSNVEITGQVNGNLFVFANDVSFNESYVRYSIFACANSVYYNGACNDLYVATNNLEMTYDSYVVRDLKALGSDVIFKAAIGRDVDLQCDTVNFGDGEDIPVIYGNLRYSAKSEATIPEEVISGDGTVTYTKPSELDNNNSIVDTLIIFLTSIVTVLIIYAIIKKFVPNFAEKLSNEKISILRLIKSFGIGLLTIILFAILFVILLITTIGLNLALILLALFVLACLISIPVLIIVITNTLKSSFKIEKTSKFCLILVLVCIVLQGIALIPFAGEILTSIISFTALGLLIDMHLPHKELTDEEKAAIQEAKVLAKAKKEKRKQEKLEAKKQAKLAKKENKD